MVSMSITWISEKPADIRPIPVRQTYSTPNFVGFRILVHQLLSPAAWLSHKGRLSPNPMSGQLCDTHRRATSILVVCPWTHSVENIVHGSEPAPSPFPILQTTIRIGNRVFTRLQHESADCPSNSSIAFSPRAITASQSPSSFCSGGWVEYSLFRTSINHVRDYSRSKFRVALDREDMTKRRRR